MTKLKSGWTLFLDRDGVINKRIPGDYVKKWEEFTFLPHALSSLKKINLYFDRVFIVTNQAGIGKGLMTTEDLQNVHKNARRIIRKHGGKITKIYFCPEVSSDSLCRKPNIGMGAEAKKDYPQIDFKKSILVGDSKSDIEFGKTLEMKTICITENPGLNEFQADYTCTDLKSFCRIFVTELLNKKVN